MIIFNAELTTVVEQNSKVSSDCILIRFYFLVLQLKRKVQTVLCEDYYRHIGRK